MSRTRVMVLLGFLSSLCACEGNIGGASDSRTSTFEYGDVDLYFEATEAVYEQVRAEAPSPFTDCVALEGVALRACFEDSLPSFLLRVMRRPASARTS